MYENGNQGGLKELGRIIRAARGDRTLRQFEVETKVSHSSIRDIEIGDRGMPSLSTLQKLAPHTPYSATELQAIALGELEITKEAVFFTAEQLLPMALKLPRSEVVRLTQMLVEFLGKAPSG